ncbi:zinc finger, CCHC-type containing protein [Tanacetum coccineum]|uniref:Zinc finger, CCHC-type containing protein n=1 Tax=Tanacetum coccineum TaxID=301880 RepID=A0ABQ5HH48_9ASTR
MPWRHIDSDVHDDFSISYNEDDTERITERIILLRKPPQPLLYMCGLTMYRRHLELSYVIKDMKGQVSKGEPIPDNERPMVRTTTLLPVGSVIPEKNAHQKTMEKPDQKIVEDREKKEKQALEKAKAKRAGESSSTAPKKKKAPRNARLTGSESEGTISAALINQSIPNPLHTASGYKQNETETSDLRISSYRACKEMISHLATPLEDEVLHILTNYEVVRHTYQSSCQSILSQAELLRRHEQLNCDYIDLCNHNDVQMEELTRLRTDCVRERQFNESLSKNLVLLESAHAQCFDREREFSDRLKDMEKERNEWRQTASDQVERIKKLEEDLGPKSKQLFNVENRDVIPVAISRLLTSVEYRKSLAMPIGLSFTADSLGGLSLGRIEEDIAAVLPNISNLDIEGLKSSFSTCYLFVIHFRWLTSTGDENPIRTLGDYSKPSHEGYRNTIELPVGNNVVPLRSDTIRLVQNGCSFHELWSEDPNQHLKDFLKLVDSLNLDVANRERTRMRLFQFSLLDQASYWLERLPAGSISTWEDLTTHFLAQFFPPGRTAKLRNDIMMFQQHQGESRSEAWTHFKDSLQKVPHHGIDLWLQVQIFYDRIEHTLKRTVDYAAEGRLRKRSAEKAWETIKELA